MNQPEDRLKNVAFRLLRPTKAKIGLTVGLLVGSFLLAGLFYRLDRLVLAGWVLVPFRIYQAVIPVFREPGYQDVMYGGCRVPYCDQASLVVTVLVSGAVYYVLAGALVMVYGHLNR